MSLYRIRLANPTPEQEHRIYVGNKSLTYALKGDDDFSKQIKRDNYIHGLFSLKYSRIWELDSLKRMLKKQYKGEKLSNYVTEDEAGNMLPLNSFLV